MDVKKLIIDKLKLKGMDILEDDVKKLLEVVKETSLEYIKQSENKYDDLLEKPIEIAFDKLVELADKINGEVG